MKQVGVNRRSGPIVKQPVPPPARPEFQPKPPSIYAQNTTEIREHLAYIIWRLDEIDTKIERMTDATS